MKGVRGVAFSGSSCAHLTLTRTAKIPLVLLDEGSITSNRLHFDKPTVRVPQHFASGLFTVEEMYGSRSHHLDVTRGALHEPTTFQASKKGAQNCAN